jgi:transposase-like protein
VYWIYLEDFSALPAWKIGFHLEEAMRKSNFTDEEILAILGEADRDRVATVAKRHSISNQTIYFWRKRFAFEGVRPGSSFELKRELASKRELAFKRELGEPLANDLEDFCAVHYGAPEINVIREAVRNFLDEQLGSEPELKKRFEKRRQARAGN